MSDLKKELQRINRNIDDQNRQKELSILKKRQEENIKEARECIEKIGETCLDYAKRGETSAPIYRFGVPPVNNYNRYDFDGVAEEYQPAVGLVIKALQEKGFSWGRVGGSRRNGFRDIVAIWREK